MIVWSNITVLSVAILAQRPFAQALKVQVLEDLHFFVGRSWYHIVVSSWYGTEGSVFLLNVTFSAETQVVWSYGFFRLFFLSVLAYLDTNALVVA